MKRVRESCDPGNPMFINKRISTRCQGVFRCYIDRRQRRAPECCILIRDRHVSVCASFKISVRHSTLSMFVAYIHFEVFQPCFRPAEQKGAWLGQLEGVEQRLGYESHRCVGRTFNLDRKYVYKLIVWCITSEIHQCQLERVGRRSIRHSARTIPLRSHQHNSLQTPRHHSSGP